MPRLPWDITEEMFLSLEGVHDLLDWLGDRSRNGPDQHRNRARLDEVIVVSLLFSGLRNSEFCNLTVGDTIIGTGQSVFLTRSKRGEGRTVHVPQHVSGLVCRYVDEIRPDTLPANVSPTDRDQPLVFSDRRRPFERTGLYRRVVRILKQAGLGNRASVQLLRHTYGYLAYLRTGGNLLFVQRQLGHAHPMITSVYAQFVNESYDALAEQIGAEPL